MRFPNRWTVGEWVFYEAVDHGFGGPSKDKPLYGFGPAIDPEGSGQPAKISEWYNTLEHAMAAAIAEKHTGRRGAGGTGVGTAADWFMRMIGVGQIQEAGPAGGRALVKALEGEEVKGLAAHRIERRLEDQGIILAREAID